MFTIRNIRSTLINLRGFVTSKKVKRYLTIVFCSFVVLNSSMAIQSFAQSEGGEEEYKIDGNGVFDTFTGQTKTWAVGVGVDSVSGVSNNMAGTAIMAGTTLGGTEIFEDYSNGASTNSSNFVRYGLVGVVQQNTMAMLNNPPTQDIPAHLASEWVPGYQDSTTSVYAQDAGYKLLAGSGISELWEKTRQLAYVLFVVVLIVAGFMIMFRQKIGGQVAITIFNTLPQVVLGLVFVTFSFAIVGLIINFGNVFTNVIKGILDTSSPIGIDGPFSVFTWFFTGTSAGTATTASASIATAIVVGFGSLVAGGPVGWGAAILGTFVGLIVAIVILAILFMISFKVWLTVIKAYISLLIDTVLAPIYLSVAVIPGKSVMQADWFRRVFKNSMTFPVVYLFVNLGVYIIESDVPISLPSGIGSGDFVSETSTAITFLVTRVAALYLMYVAAEAPKILEDFFPQASNTKGTQTAFQTAAKKIPVIGNLIGG